jgi:hypothetical protein
MGTLLDTTVFIELERGIRRPPAASAMDEVSKRLEEQLGPTEEVRDRYNYGVGTAARSALGNAAAPRTPGSLRRGGPGRVSPVRLDRLERPADVRPVKGRAGLTGEDQAVIAPQRTRRQPLLRLACPVLA